MKIVAIIVFVIAISIGIGIWARYGGNVSLPTTTLDGNQNESTTTVNGIPQEPNLTNPTPQPSAPKGNPVAVFETTKGTFEVELFRDKTPKTTTNFVNLSIGGFYNETKFHRVIKGFMIQGGDPNSEGSDTSLYGFGGPGYTIEDEFVSGLSNVRGTISMANTGRPNSGGSQFFINLVNNTGLDYDKAPFTSSHAVFGKVIKGMDIVDAIGNTATGQNDIPLVPVVVKRITIQE